MKRSSSDAHRMMTSVSDDYTTPADVWRLVSKVSKILLDPCSNQYSSIPTSRWCFRFEKRPNGELGGLSEPWLPYCVGGLVYVNPPYGRTMSKWATKIVTEAALGCTIITLTPARTDTAWLDELERHADAVCFWRGRITFGGRPSNGQPAMFPSVLHYFGDDASRFCDVFSPHGRTYVISAAAQPASQAQSTQRRRAAVETGARSQRVRFARTQQPSSGLGNAAQSATARRVVGR